MKTLRVKSRVVECYSKQQWALNGYIYDKGYNLDLEYIFTRRLRGREGHRPWHWLLFYDELA